MSVRSDREPLVNEAEYEDEQLPRLLDAALSSSDIEAPALPAGSRGGSSSKWFILEPAVFLIFVGRSLIGKEF